MYGKKELLDKMMESGKEPSVLVSELGMMQISNDDEIPVNAEKYAISELREQLGCEYEEVLHQTDSLPRKGPAPYS